MEYDPIDFAALTLMVKVKRGKQVILRFVEFSFTLEFPEKPPQITIHEFGSAARSWKLDPVLYRYSPRWDASRMGEELFNHACQSIGSLI